VEKGCCGHGHALFVDGSLISVPDRISSTDAIKLDIAIVFEKVSKNSGRIIRARQRLPSRRVASEETRLPQRKQHMPKTRGRIKTLGQIILTKGLFELSKDPRISLAKDNFKPALGGLGEGFPKGPVPLPSNNRSNRVALLGTTFHDSNIKEFIRDFVIGNYLRGTSRE
jgi:hypothetical protein